MSLFAELKRRNVFRVGLAYLVASWLLMQMVDVLAPIFTLPDWAPKLIFLILAVGFIPAIIFSWVFEMTPEGIKRESEIDRSSSITPITAKKLDMVTMSSFFAVTRVIESLRSISDSRLMPSGVISKTQEKMITGMNPTARIRKISFGAQSGSAKTGARTSTICISSHEATRKARLTRMTLRRFSSANRLMLCS